ncbi:MAG TPA: hypothetical protein VGD58_22805 [Herpetosiphonaceae bacterium]
MLDRHHIQALREICSRLVQLDIPWVVTGSCGLLLQGVPVTVRDIDLQTDQQGAYAIARLFAAEVARPIRQSHTDRIQSHFGALSLHTIEVEIMGAVQYRQADGAWSRPVDVRQHRRFVPFEELELPVLDLRYERQAYANLGRAGKVAMLERWLAQPS